MKDWLKEHCTEIKIVLTTFAVMLLLVVIWIYCMYGSHTEFQIIIELGSMLIVAMTIIVADVVLEIVKRR